MNFINRLLEVTSSVESPTSFLKWAAYSALATVMRDNVFIPFGARRTKVYPNLYVMLIGDSGNTRKGTPLKIVNSLVKSVGNNKIIEGRASIQGVLKELSEDRRNSKGYLLQGASGLLYSEEFAAFLVQDPSATKILTDIYDYHEEHPIFLKGEDPVRLKNVVVNLLTASNATFLSDMFSKIDIFGGLIGRTIMVVEEKARHRNLGLTDNTTEKDWDDLVNHLRKVAKFKGAVKFSREAEEFANAWYNNLSFASDSKTGFEPRVHTHVLKLCMLISAAEMDQEFESQMIISVDVVEKAISEVALLLPYYHKIVNNVTSPTNNVATISAEILKVLIANPEVKVEHAALLRTLMSLTDGEILDKALNTLKVAELIEVTQGGKGIVYSLSKIGKDKFLMKLGNKGMVN